MKKCLAPLLALLLILPLAACASEKGGGTQGLPPTGGAPEASAAVSAPISSELPVEYFNAALVTSATVSDDYNREADEAIALYAAENGLTYKRYDAENYDNSDGLYDAMLQAIDDGARVLILPGSVFGSAIAQMQTQYAEVMFLGIDVPETELMRGDILVKPAANTALIMFHEEQAGYLAGYAAVMNGYTSLGFIGAMPIPGAARYGFGFIQGADAAAAKISSASGSKTTADIDYWYANTFYASDDVRAVAAAWYGSGTEIIFVCGDRIQDSVIAAADASGRKLICADTDEAAKSQQIAVSAVKNISGAVTLALTDLYDHGVTWPDKYAGACQYLGAKESMVGLSAAKVSWRLSLYSADDYQTLFDKLRMGDLTVEDPGDDVSARPETANSNVSYKD
jgi:basic membrane protein A